MKREKHWMKRFHTSLWRRAASVALAAVLLWGLIPAMPGQRAQAAEWMEPYLRQVVDWGIMRGDANGNLNPDRQITRAELVVMMNRAFGYTELGPNPFTDVPDNAWYAEDIRIAHKAGYFYGTSPTTASPANPVTREQAAALLGRSLRLQGAPGSITSFYDNNDIGVWSRGLVQEAANMGIIQGYEDGNFRPKTNITRGQMAVFLVRALGTLIKDPGTVSSGGVYGNLTITSPGVSLKDTVITGNLYLTGGVGLGNVELENVNVMGKIVVCGAGESQEGENSIVLRNVTAGAMEVDSLTNQFLTIRAEGLTNIADTTVRTSAYLEDLTNDGLGMKYIELDGSDSTRLHLAGNIKEVKDVTPGSSILVAQGVSNKITMDEKAVGAAITIDGSASVRELNLDLATPVTGTGSISKLNVNADGSTVSMLPDDIYIRPGITSNIRGENMDSTLAAESSDDPRLLSGYPFAKNVASTSADAVFSTNKRGTIHWAVSALTDGSLSERELMNPTEASSKIIKNGTINATASKTEFTTRLTGLTMSGSYYISALLVDSRDRRSPVKVAAFTTTDDSVPNFATGYPTTILTTASGNDKEQIIQARVMATKSCQLYWALLPKGSAAPTGNALKSGAVTGNLGYGMREVLKNTPYTIQVNSAYLEELTQYDLYLWLNDADSGKSSAVRKLTVTTLDKTEPVVTNIYQSKSDRTSAQITFSVNEKATLFWVAVKAGEVLLRPTVPGEPVDLKDMAAKIQVESGGGNANVVSSGSASAANAGTNYTFTINRLEEQGVYDLYYVAKDTAGNYSVSVLILENVMTSDGTPPQVEVQFSRYNEGANGTVNPWVESDVSLVFNEIVRGTYRDGRTDVYEDFYTAYEKVLNSAGDAREGYKEALGEILRKYIQFYPGTPPTTGNPRTDPVTDNDGTLSQAELDELPCWIDYREAVVTRSNGRTTVTFPAVNSVGEDLGIKMQSGGTYFFRIENIVDASGNMIAPNPTYTPSPGGFTTAFATVRLSNNQNEETVIYPEGTDPRAAKLFRLAPEDTEAVPEDTRWDMLIWTDSSIDYQLLVRQVGETEWFELGTARPSVTNVASGKVYSSLNGNFNTKVIESGYFGSVGLTGSAQGRPFLHEFSEELEFAIVPVESTLENVVNMEVQLFAGSNTEFSNVSIPQGQESTLAGRDITAIGEPDPFPITISPPGRAPIVSVPYLGIDAGDIAATVQLMVDRPGRVYYMAIPLETLPTGTPDGDGYPTGNDYVMYGTYPEIDDIRPNLEAIPTSLRRYGEQEPMWLDPDAPSPRQVIRGTTESTRIRTGSTGNTLLEPDIPRLLNIPGLEADTTYIMYLVSTDENGTPAEKALCYKFTTTPPEPPKITIQPNGSTRANILVDKPATVDYVLVRSQQIQDSSNPFSAPFTGTMLAKALPSGWSGTVLDAMLAAYNENDEYMGSIFDICASTATKMEYAEYIREPNGVFVSPPPAMNGRNIPVSSETGQFNLTGMEGQNYYTLVVVARGQNSNSDGFRASRSYYNVVNDFLYLLNCDIGENTSATAAATYSGTLRMTFSDSVHFSVRDGNEEKPYPVDSCGLSHGLHTGSGNVSADTKHVNIGSFMFPSQGIVLANPAPPTDKTQHGSTVGPVLEFTLTNARPGASITFRSGMCGANGAVRSNTTAASLTVTLRRQTVGTGADATTEWYLEWTDAWNRSTEP